MRHCALFLAIAVGCSSHDRASAEESVAVQTPEAAPEGEAVVEPEGQAQGAGAGAREGVVAPAVVRACAPPRRTSEAPRLREGIVYSRPGGRPLALDLALPAGRGPHPVVLVFHGGAWRAGERAHVREEIAVLARLGYAGAAIDYRLVDGYSNTFPAAIADARCAVRHLRSRAADLDLDPDRIGALGYSSGAQVALMLATASDVAGLDDGCADVGTSPAVRAAIGVASPTDLRPEARFTRPADRAITRFLGTTRRRDPDAAALASPIAHVGGGDAATLLIHGTADRVIPIEQPRRLRAALARAGAPVTLVELDGVEHGFRLFGDDPRVLPGVCTAVAFLRAALGP